MTEARICFLADVNLDENIIHGHLRLQPDIDFMTATVAGLAHVPDEQVLAIAARLDRILVTQDKRTMPQHFADFLMSGQHSPGVFLVLQNRQIGDVIADLLLIWRASEPDDWLDQLERLPWR